MIEADFRAAAREVERQDQDRQDRLEAAIAADADARLAAGLPLRRGRKRRADETPRRTYFPTKGLMVADTEVGQRWHPTANGELDPRKVSASSTKIAMWLSAASTRPSATFTSGPRRSSAGPASTPAARGT